MCSPGVDLHIRCSQRREDCDCACHLTLKNGTSTVVEPKYIIHATSGHVHKNLGNTPTTTQFTIGRPRSKIVCDRTTSMSPTQALVPSRGSGQVLCCCERNLFMKLTHDLDEGRVQFLIQVFKQRLRRIEPILPLDSLILDFNIASTGTAFTF